MADEETLLQSAFERYAIKQCHRESIMRYLSILRARSEETYFHSIRVCLLAASIGDFLSDKGIKAKPLFWAGLLHDIGKALVDPDLFEKKDHFTEDDYKRMEPHVEYDFRLLREVHEWTAHIIVRHHRFGRRPYPKEIPVSGIASGASREIFDTYGRLLALADFYDALMTRDNEKFGNVFAKNEKREIYFRENADQKDLILELEKAGILTFSS